MICGAREAERVPSVRKDGHTVIALQCLLRRSSTMTALQRSLKPSEEGNT